jgi:hypothetical protein
MTTDLSIIEITKASIDDIEYVFKRGDLTVIELKDGKQIEFDPDDLGLHINRTIDNPRKLLELSRFFRNLVAKVPHESCERPRKLEYV